jgi:protein phosphatase
MKQLQFRLAARTDAAGKYNAEAPLEGNEDNMYVDSDLSNNAQGEFMADQVVDLSDKGCLMVVADGMGGMNAGEVASDIAIKTVTSYFSPERMAETSFRDSRARCKYLEQVVEAADEAIKNDARRDKEHEGMGSTIILAWLCDDEICLTWCGDSRAYLFRPGKGFWQVSKDHSYVQGLVDDGKITIDEAFDHPYGNIITRSLGDPEKRAKADSKVFPVFEGDIFMLCSDGLSGVLRDHKTYDPDGQRIDTENLEDIIDANRHSMTDCRDALFAAAERNDWYDNVTAIVCEIVSGKPLPANLNEPPVSYPTPKVAHPEPLPGSDGEMINPSLPPRKKHLPLIIALVVVLLAGGGVLTWWLTSRYSNNNAEQRFFENCVNSNDYRTFLKLYPDGKNAELAKAKLEELYQDSCDKANNAKGLVDANQVQQKDDPKPDDKVKKEEKKVEKKEKDQDRNESTTGGTDKQNDPNNPKLKDSKGDLKDSNGDLKDSNGDNKSLKERLTPVTPEGRGKSTLSPTQSAPAKNEEEAYNRCVKSNSYEACADYLDKWGDKDKKNEQHFNSIRSLFVRLYRAKANSCSTKEECEKFLKEHDKIMKRARMTRSTIDSESSKKVNDKLKELTEGNAGQTSQNANTSGRQSMDSKPNSKPNLSIAQQKKTKRTN